MKKKTKKSSAIVGVGSASLQKQLKERKLEFEILRQIMGTISFNLDLKQILGSVIDIVNGYIKSDSCFIYLIDGDNLILEASQNPRKAALGKIKMRMGEGITGWVAQHEETVAISAKAYKDKRFKFFNMLPEDKFEAFLSIPINFKDKVVGVVNIQHVKQKKYDKDKINFLELVAQLVGGAIENARLVSQTNLLKEALETRKMVERAKSILMEKGSLTEAEAHRLINKKSMDKRRSIKEIAEAIVLSEEILK